MTKAFAHVLIATDFGDVATAALDDAVALASMLDAKLTIVHVCTTPETYGYAAGLDIPIAELRREAQRSLDMTVARAKARHPPTTGLLAAGSTAEAIVRAAEHVGADVVVMGTHGRHGLARAFLGSTAQRVIRMSPLPVLTVGPRATLPPA